MYLTGWGGTQLPSPFRPQTWLSISWDSNPSLPADPRAQNPLPRRKRPVQHRLQWARKEGQKETQRLLFPACLLFTCNQRTVPLGVRYNGGQAVQLPHPSCLPPSNPTGRAPFHSPEEDESCSGLSSASRTSCGLGVNILPAVQLPAAMPETSLYWGPSPGSQSNPSWPTLHHLSYGLLSGNPSCRTQVVVKAMQILKQLP